MTAVCARRGGAPRARFRRTAGGGRPGPRRPPAADTAVAAGRPPAPSMINRDAAAIRKYNPFVVVIMWGARSFTHRETHVSFHTQRHIKAGNLCRGDGWGLLGGSGDPEGGMEGKSQPARSPCAPPPRPRPPPRRRRHAPRQNCSPRTALATRPFTHVASPTHQSFPPALIGLVTDHAMIYDADDLAWSAA